MSVLSKTKKLIIVNAGHWDSDSGATHNEYIEAIECMKIRDQLTPILRSRGYNVLEVPDELDLRKSIAWANAKAPSLNDALAIDIHLNALSNSSARGSEAFHGTSGTSISIANALTENVSEAMGIPDRGAKPDTQTAVGSLGWIRKTTMWASLIEVCFLTNEDDMEALRGSIGGTNGYVDAAKGIANGIDEVYGNVVVTPIKPNPLAKYTLSQLFAEISRRILKLRA